MIEGVVFNGESANSEKSLYTILNVGFPESSDNDMLLFNLDINNISVSGGSACSSGSNIGSHVLTALKTNPDLGAVRFSFSKYNTLKEVEYVTDKLASFFKVSV
jgi:cysteine desulfurase